MSAGNASDSEEILSLDSFVSSQPTPSQDYVGIFRHFSARKRFKNHRGITTKEFEVKQEFSDGKGPDLNRIRKLSGFLGNLQKNLRESTFFRWKRGGFGNFIRIPQRNLMILERKTENLDQIIGIP